MRAHAALLLLSVAITSALCMNYKSEANRNLLITRLPVLAIRDVQYPSTEAKADYDRLGPGPPAIWEDVGLTKPDFFDAAIAAFFEAALEDFFDAFFLVVFVVLLELEAGPLEGVGLGAIITAGVWCPRAAALLGCYCGRVIRQKATSSPCLHEEVGHVCLPRGLVFDYRLLFLWHLISYHKRKSPS